MDRMVLRTRFGTIFWTTLGMFIVMPYQDAAGSSAEEEGSTTPQMMDPLTVEMTEDPTVTVSLVVCYVL